MSKIEQ